MRCHVLALVLLALMAVATGKVVTYEAKLNSRHVVGPPVSSSAKGIATVKIINSTFAVGTWKITSKIEDAWMAHIHLGNATSNGPIAVVAFTFTLNNQPQYISGQFSGRYTFDPSANNLATMLADGNTYFNVHTLKVPGGEIRGQFKTT